MDNNTQTDLVKLFAQKNALQDQMIARNRYARAAIKGYAFAAVPDPIL
ncbi:MAG: hypothetical protein IKB16_05745 [Lentisphaeria bacterium]|nr:hypothetical protein [Lentisphaeria bacterium]